MSDTNNTIAGWVLGAGIVALGSYILTDTLFHADIPEGEKVGYMIEDEAPAGEEEAGPAMETLLASADVGKGESTFKKCVACHTITPGGANGIGPNLYSIMGRQIAAVGGFGYSDALKSVGGAWTWQQMDAWIKSPKKFANGTKMTFAGIGNAEDRAALLVYMNDQGSNLPLPAAPIVEPEPVGDAEAVPEAAEGEAQDVSVDAPATEEAPVT